MVGNGKQIAAGLRHIDQHGSDPASRKLAEEMAFFLVARCEARHAGWRVVRQLVVESAAEPPWEKCARRAVPLVVEDLIRMSEEGGRTPLHRAQHVAAMRRVETIAPYADPEVLLADLKIDERPADDDDWIRALRAGAAARSRESARKKIAAALSDEEPDED